MERVERILVQISAFLGVPLLYVQISIGIALLFLLLFARRNFGKLIAMLAILAIVGGLIYAGARTARVGIEAKRGAVKSP